MTVLLLIDFEVVEGRLILIGKYYWHFQSHVLVTVKSLSEQPITS